MTDRLNAARLIELAEGIGVDPVYLEKDFVLTEVIHGYATGPHRDVLVLKGGQALRHIYGSARLSNLKCGGGTRIGATDRGTRRF